MASLEQFLILALDNRTPEAEAMAAMRAARKQLSGKSVYEALAGFNVTLPIHAHAINHVPYSYFASMSRAAYEMATTLTLKEFQFKVCPDPEEPSSPYYARLEYSFKGTPQQSVMFSQVVKNWIDQINGGNTTTATPVPSAPRAPRVPKKPIFSSPPEPKPVKKKSWW